ncbi:MAG: manganese efflux pump [Syntrophomonadaceae bacterium]|nr:manganese efflux pump [Syntrophomonadaceae bacterium]MDD3023274.1 manganese efflux pump [Syntrophomonadaceae bacterium]
MYEQIFTVGIVALVLGMDAFSLAVGMGLKGVSRSYEIKFSCTVAILHILMPLLGLNLGLVAGKLLGVWAARLGALVLAWLGSDLLIKGYRQKNTFNKFGAVRQTLGYSGARRSEWTAIIFLGISVSIDALTAGFSLGTLKMPILFTVLLIGTIAGSMTMLGFAGGRISGRWLGAYAQMLGGVVLVALAIKFLL